LPDVAQRLAIDRVNRDPQRPLTICRLLRWIHLRHGDLLLRGTPDRLYRIFSALSSLRTGFSPQPTVRSRRPIDLLRVRSPSRRLPFAQMRLNEGNPARQRREATLLIVIVSGILGTGYLAWVYTLNSGGRLRRCRARDRRRGTSLRGWGRRVRLRSAS